MYFSEHDLKQVESLVYDPTLEPGYEILKGCLVWADERPDNMTSEGWEKLCDLWIARSFIHKGRPPSSHLLDPKYFETAWNTAVAEGISWPGFKRLVLSEKDREYYRRAEEECADEI